MDTLTRGINKESCVCACVSVKGRREVGERGKERREEAKMQSFISWEERVS